jgi:NAD(P)-dependent dehydrogenase (short-subunit alcohol dehydrogenase family)
MLDSVLGVNLFGVVNGTQTFVPRMIARGAGAHISKPPPVPAWWQVARAFVHHLEVLSGRTV